MWPQAHIYSNKVKDRNSTVCIPYGFFLPFDSSFQGVIAPLTSNNPLYKLGVLVWKEVDVSLEAEISPSRVPHQNLSKFRNGNPSSTLYRVCSCLGHSDIIFINRSSRQPLDFAFIIVPWTYPLKGKNFTLPKGTKVKISHPAQTRTVSIYFQK